jgi:hypothetical protein
VAHLLAPDEVDLEPNDPWGWALNELGLTREAIWIERSRPGWAQLLDQLVAAQVLEETPPDAVGRGSGRGPVWEAPIAAGAPPRPLELVAVWRPHPVLGFDLGYRILADGFLALWFLPRWEGRGALGALRRYLRQVEICALEHLRGAAWTVTANDRHRLLLRRVVDGGAISELPSELAAVLERDLIRPLRFDVVPPTSGSRHTISIRGAPGEYISGAIVSFLAPHAPVIICDSKPTPSSRFYEAAQRLAPCYILVPGPPATLRELNVIAVT